LRGTPLMKEMNLRSEVTIPVLVIGLTGPESGELRAILRPPQWEICEAAAGEEAGHLLDQRRIPVAICDAKAAGDWQELLRDWQNRVSPPHLIVSSRCADERLWAEVLNLGAYDLLAQPFDPSEVLRVAGAASRAWRAQDAPPNGLQAHA